MIPKIIHQTAPSSVLTPEELRLRRRTARLMTGWELKLWDDEDNAKLVKQAFPEHYEIYMNIRRGVVKADIARCVYLHLFGGWYLDTDYKILRPFGDEFLQYHCVLPISGAGDDIHLVCNSVMASEPHYPLWKGFLDVVFSNPALTSLEEQKVEGITGPLGLSRYYLQHREEFSDIYLPPKPWFHPRVTMKGFWYDRSYPSYGAHLCWGSWRSKDIVRKVKNYAARKLTSF